MSSVDFQGFNLSKNNTYIYLGDKNTVSEWLILGAVLLPEAQICKIREFKPRKPLSYSEYWANYRLHRLWLYALLPSNLWNALHKKKEEVCNAGKGPESSDSSMAVTYSILGADGRSRSLGVGLHHLADSAWWGISAPSSSAQPLLGFTYGSGLSGHAFCAVLPMCS